MLAEKPTIVSIPTKKDPFKVLLTKRIKVMERNPLIPILINESLYLYFLQSQTLSHHISTVVYNL